MLTVLARHARRVPLSLHLRPYASSAAKVVRSAPEETKAPLSPPQPIVLDGCHLHGGGLLVRNAMILSSVLGKPILINNVRKNRPDPGLKDGHVTELRLLAAISQGSDIKGNTVGSTRLEFYPGQCDPGAYVANTGNDGSLPFILQTAIPCLLSPTSRSVIDGKTSENVLTQLDFSYVQKTLIPFLKRHFGISAIVEQNVVEPEKESGTASNGPTKPGKKPLIPGKKAVKPKKAAVKPSPAPEQDLELSDPESSSAPSTTDAQPSKPASTATKTVRLHVLPFPSKLPPLILTSLGRVTSVRGTLSTASVPRNAAYEMREQILDVLLAERYLEDTTEQLMMYDIAGQRKPEMRMHVVMETDTGAMLTFTDTIVEPMKSEMFVPDSMFKLIVHNLRPGICVNETLVEQIIPYLALADGHSEVRIGEFTPQTQTAIWVAEQLTDARFEVFEETDANGVKTNRIHCDGIGWDFGAARADTPTKQEA